ncbi:MAG: hypothetical protein CBB87_11455 [Micavibrio sp. TMED27]|nr:hypothetical protein [Micavibrio sp.]OUT89909.1 MAG: hypothetical protein CBB87_11455 [Micavibrio sp. TMED27]|tara:strand:- start:4771 stop:5451 length:681 start_codon:yes stop_codon:yes gene_type:complete
MSINISNFENEIVVLLHGILRSKLDMLPLAKRLEAEGYDVINILYPSREHGLEDLTEYVREKIISASCYSTDKKINFVAHSMGGLITRYYIHRYRPENLGSVVMLGTPNTGSEFADFLDDNEWLGPVFRSIFGPASAQLKTDYAHVAGDIDYPLGVIAGSASVNPLAPWVLVGAHDGIVPVERTRIEGMSDHIVMDATHSFMMFNKNVIEQVLSFLKNGKFTKNAD